MIIRHDADYRELRKQSYPDVGEQLDAVFKLAKHLQSLGQDLPPDVEKWVNDCQEVKDKFPNK
ncbi:hypothetical protein E4695_04200 [Alcaligenaceae bacterium 429]|nr:hypothetical protein E4695_04200 [Alcaligenaceae bacterium 429]